MRKCLFTYISDEFTDLLQASRPTHEFYAELFGYDYQVFDPQRLSELGIEVGWSTKIELFKYLFTEGKYDVAFWIDVDAIFAKFDRDALGEMYASGFQAFVMEISANRWNPNAGVWLMKNTPQANEFISDILDYGVVASCWKDQAAVMRSLGWNMEAFPGGNKLISPSKFLAGTDWLDPSWNYIPGLNENIPSSIRVIHFAGANMTNKERAAEILKARNQLQRKFPRRLPWIEEKSTHGHRSY